MSSHYVAKFLSAIQRREMESRIADGSGELLFEDWLEDDDILCIGASTDAWVYMACRAYLVDKDCWPNTMITPFGRQLFATCDMIDLYIPHEHTAAAVTGLARLGSGNDDPLPHIRNSLVEWQKDGYVQELDSVPDHYFEFLESFEQHMKIASSEEKSLLVFVPY